MNTCYVILYTEGMGSEIQATDKTNEVLPAMTVCRNIFHNGPMAYTCYAFIKVLSTELLWHV